MRTELCKKRLHLMKHANTKVLKLVQSGVSYSDERITKILEKLDKDISQINDFF